MSRQANHLHGGVWGFGETGRGNPNRHRCALTRCTPVEPSRSKDTLQIGLVEDQPHPKVGPVPSPTRIHVPVDLSQNGYGPQ
eukprot:12904486-Prorocentrum_lima.AAC.1